MFPELVTRADLEVFLPPIGGHDGLSVRRSRALGRPETHGSPAACMTNATAPTCSAPTSAPAAPISRTASRCASQTAQEGGVGIIVYNRKEGRALGEVTKFLVYNARKRQQGGDRAEAYFRRTECVAGVQDMRFQELMPDVLHWLGITRIDRLVSMSNMKYDAIVRAAASRSSSASPIPDGLIPADAQVEIDAKKAAGYLRRRVPATRTELKQSKGPRPAGLSALPIAVSPIRRRLARDCLAPHAAAVRERCHALLDLGERGELAAFHRRYQPLRGRFDATWPR